MQPGLSRWVQHASMIVQYETRNLPSAPDDSQSPGRNETLYQTFSELAGLRQCAFLVLQYVPHSAAPRPPRPGA